MIKIRHIFLVLLAAIVAGAGCASTPKTQIPEVDIRDFRQRCTYQFEMPFNSMHAMVTVFSVPQVVMADIELADSTENVLFVKLYENEHLNIDKHLIRNFEYLYDKDSRILKVIFDLPVVYLLKESLDFRIQAVATRKKGPGMTGKKIEKQISFYWSPHVFVTEPESGHVLMKYVDPIKQDYQRKDELIKRVNQEILITNTKRLNPGYRLLIERFSGGKEQ